LLALPMPARDPLSDVSGNLTSDVAARQDRGSRGNIVDVVRIAGFVDQVVGQ